MHSGVAKETLFLCLLRLLENLKVGLVREIFASDISGITTDARILVMATGGDFNNPSAVGESMESGVADAGHGHIEKESPTARGGSWEIMRLMPSSLWQGNSVFNSWLVASAAQVSRCPECFSCSCSSWSYIVCHCIIKCNFNQEIQRIVTMIFENT